jgi:hypothetical protein
MQALYYEEAVSYKLLLLRKVYNSPGATAVT